MDNQLYQHPSLQDTLLTENGLNLHAVFNIDELPHSIQIQLQALDITLAKYRQLILIGHAGKTLWEAVKQSGINTENPIDDFTMQIINHLFASELSNNCYQILYPGIHAVGLQTLGKLAGWQHTSPFMLGINNEWGTWFAYRALLLADSQLETSSPLNSDSPCDSCSHKVCISSCAGAALENDTLDFQQCVSYRKQPISRCKNTCLSRLSCPLAAEHRYSEEQIQYHYSLSMKTIEQNY